MLGENTVFEDIKQLISTLHFAGDKDKQFVNDELNILEKQLKFAEIIKENYEYININWLLISCSKKYSYNEYKKVCNENNPTHGIATRTEYNFIKEYLNP